MNTLSSVLHPLFGTGDPLYANGVGWVVLLIVLIKVLVVFGALMVAVMLMIWFERKVISDMQSRIGPNRAGPWGLLQTLADGTKLFFKEGLLPERADRPVYLLAPYLSLIPALLIFTVVPVGGIIT
ncbi:MAG: NADH-quinone oxidoreductase subunit H, partial [Acidimicrobiales bacterium]